MITAAAIQQYQTELQGLTTIGEFKALGRRLKEEHNLTDREAMYEKGEVTCDN